MDVDGAEFVALRDSGRAVFQSLGGDDDFSPAAYWQARSALFVIILLCLGLLAVIDGPRLLGWPRLKYEQLEQATRAWACLALVLMPFSAKWRIAVLVDLGVVLQERLAAVVCPLSDRLPPGPASALEAHGEHDHREDRVEAVATDPLLG